MYENTVANTCDIVSQWYRQTRMPRHGIEAAANSDVWYAHRPLLARRRKMITLLLGLKTRFALRSGEPTVPERLSEISV